MLNKFLKDESGSTAIEYSLIAAMTGIIAIGSISLLGNNLTVLNDTVAAEITTATNNSK
jgi:Flp pilus assembly pilin Flp